MNQETFTRIKEHVLSVLDRNLPEHLTYHSTEHTRYVLEKTKLIADKEQVTGHEQLLLKIAALYHDIGFIESYQSRKNRL